MDWKRITTDGYPPETEDVDVLLKVENAPIQYIAAVWDGKRFWMLEATFFRTAPWTIVPSEVGIIEWAYIKENDKR